MALKKAQKRRQKRAKGHLQGPQARGKNRRAMTDTLPDEVMLEIFDACIISESDDQSWKWVRLVHVCRRWRQIIFASPCRLHLQLGCTHNLKTQLREYLCVWPAFPIFINYNLGEDGLNINDNVKAALEHPDRVCGLYLDDLTAPQLKELAAVTRKPFPVLKKLRLRAHVRNWVDKVLPNGFLGGSAPRLQELHLSSIPFPGLTTLLFSARELVALRLDGITKTGYISSKAMVAVLIALPKLETFSIGFNAKVPHLGQTQISPTSRTVLPSLTSFVFSGFSNYLEDLVAPIDCPQLNYINVTYSFNRHVDWQVSQLFNFINRSEDPRLTLCSRAAICAEPTGGFTLDLCHGRDYNPIVRIFTSSEGWRVSHLTWLLDQFSAKLSDVYHLTILWFVLEELGHAQWVQLLSPFANVHTLYGFGDKVEKVALALEDAAEGEMADELFPALVFLCWGGLEPNKVISIPKFEAARQHSGKPITIHEISTT